MRWPLARRLLALPLTVLVVTVLAFAALSAGGSEDPALAHLPRFLNTRLLDVRARADQAVAALAEADDPEAAHTLARLGGAALPVVLPRLDGLSPGPRTRVALSLAPVAARMELPDVHQDPARAAAAWQRWWEDHAPDWKPVAIRRVVRRYVTHPSPARLADVRHLDTAALLDIVLELSRDPSPEVREGLVSAAEHALQMSSADDLPARTAELEATWRARGLDFVALDGAQRPVAAVLETRYGKWAVRALVGDLGRARDGRAVLLVILASARTTLSLVLAGAPIGALVAVVVALVGAARRQVALLGPVIALGAIPAVVAAVSWGPPLLRGALAIGAVVLAGTLPVVQARLAESLAQPDVVTARAFGASELRIAWRALRAGALPVALACLGTTLPAAFTAAFVVEKLLALPGLGRVAVEAMAARDVTVLMAIAVLASLCGVVALAVADLAQLAGDRRIAEAP